MYCTGRRGSVRGEETALMASIKGRRGQIVTPPALPGASGLLGQADLGSTMETHGQHCPDHCQWLSVFASIGTGKEQGHQKSCAGGQGGKKYGLIEVPMGNAHFA